MSDDSSPPIRFAITKYGRLYLLAMALSALVVLLALFVFIPFFAVGERVAYTIALLGIAGTLGLPGAIGWYERKERLRHDAASDVKANKLQAEVELLKDELRGRSEADPFALGALTLLKGLLPRPRRKLDAFMRTRVEAAARRMGVDVVVVDDYWTALEESVRKGLKPEEIVKDFRSKVEERVIEDLPLRLFDLGQRLANLAVGYGIVADRVEYLVGQGATTADDVRNTANDLGKLLADTKVVYATVESRISSRLQDTAGNVIEVASSMQSAIEDGHFGSSLIDSLKKGSEVCVQLLTALA